MKKIFIILLISSSIFSVHAQVISIDDYNISPGDNVLVSIDLQNLTNIGALTLFVGYDSAVLQYDTILNINGQFNGLLANNMNNVQIGMVWSAFLSGVTISSGQLCQLQFTFLGGSCNLVFNPGCEIADFNANTISTTFESGSVSEIITASITGLASGYCIDHAPLSLTGTPSGGSFTVNGISANTFAPDILGVGSHSVEYMVVNNYGFGDTITQIVDVWGLPVVNLQTQNVICFGQTTGEASALVSQGLTPYTYAWSDGQTTSVAVNLTAGNYSLVVTDINGCEDSETFEILQGNEIVVTEEVSHLSALGASDGAIDLTIGGGNPPFQFLWSNGATSEDVNNISHGIFFVTITDASMCELVTEARVRIHSSQQISLPVQWSMFSFNIEHYEPAVDSVLLPIVNNVALVKDENGNVYWPIFNLNVIGDFIYSEGYQIKCDIPVSFSSNGFYLFPEEETISLPIGWSLFSYLRTTNISVEAGMNNVISNISLMKNGDGQVFWPQYGLNNIPAMIPGQGYQIKMNLADSLIYPAN